MTPAEILTKAVKILESCIAKDSKTGLMIYTPEWEKDKVWLGDQLINSLSREKKLIEQRDEAIRLQEIFRLEVESMRKNWKPIQSTFPTQEQWSGEVDRVDKVLEDNKK